MEVLAKTPLESGAGRVLSPAAEANTRPRCSSARRGLAFYRIRASHWKILRGIKAEVRIAQPRGCAHTLWLAKQWRSRAWKARQAYYSWIDQRNTLRDFRFCDGCQAWKRAVAEVQRVFPGTESWLLSCSAAEGGHGRWVGYAGVGYSTWLRDSDTVGGPLQFRFSTFTGMYRRATDHAVGRGFKVPRMDSTTAWRSALGQALAGGWARYTGNDDSHWSASFGRGC